MARLLQFTTGCSQLPPGGFQDLNPRFQITAAPTFGNLPTAHTCFNQLCLPDYESFEHFEKALLIAISEGTEGFGMVWNNKNQMKIVDGDHVYCIHFLFLAFFFLQNKSL